MAGRTSRLHTDDERTFVRGGEAHTGCADSSHKDFVGPPLNYSALYSHVRCGEDGDWLEGNVRHENVLSDLGGYGLVGPRGSRRIGRAGPVKIFAEKVAEEFVMAFSAESRASSLLDVQSQASGCAHSRQNLG
jgi:hypothetical protein